MGWADRYIELLQVNGEVKFRPRGNSMTPKIKSGQLVTVRTYESINKYPEKGDIVLCKVAGKQYVHKITAIKEKVEGNLYQISNNHGRINGHVGRQSIYGCVILIE